MGVIRWLNRVDPEAWARACDLLTAEPPKSPAAAESFLRQFGRQASEHLILEFEDLEEEPGLRSSLLNGLLEEATKVETWELDKSLSHGLERVPRWIPALAPLRKIIDFKGIDREVPRQCEPEDGSGLFGCITSAGLSDCVAASRSFETIEHVVAALRETKPSFVASLFGHKDQLASLSANLDNDYFASHWLGLRAAILETSSKGHDLGLGMST